jgi:hypothetical protein
MNRIPLASLVFVTAIVFAPLPAAAQGGPPAAPGPGSSLQGQVDALTAAVAALQTALANEASARAAADSTLQTNINSEASSRAAADAALDARVAKFEGNITAADLEGTYNLYMVATVLENSSGANTITSYVVTGTMTFAAGGTGQVENTVAAGRVLTERLPGQTWLVSGASASGAFDGSFSWVYNNGVVTINAAGDINDFTPTAGGQVMLGVQGGSPGDNQIMFVLTRQPSI